MTVPASVASPPFDVRRSLLLPAGWRAEVWARVGGARFAAWTPTGELLVSVPGAGEVVRLIPGRDPATPPLQRAVLSGLAAPQGLAFDRGALYVAEPTRLLRYAWPNLEAPRVTRLRSFGARGLAVAAGHTVVVAGGFSLVRVTDGRSVSGAAPNAQGVAVDPDGGVWLAVNDLQDAPDRLTLVAGGEADATRLLQPHSVPLGMHFLQQSRLPARWRGGAVVALHGADSPTAATRPAVAWLPWRRHELGPPVTLVAGFRRLWGRPVDAVPGPDGSLYVTDDTAGAVYRLTPPP